MDASHFDHLSRRLGARLTRRGAIARAAVALAGAAGATTFAAGDARAARGTCRNAGGSCTRNAQCCSGACATGRDVPRARRNKCQACAPGALTCGATCCPAGSACIDDACVATCERTTGSQLCLLTARQIVQFATCSTIVIETSDTISCTDDADCIGVDLKHPGPELEHFGCLISLTDDNGPSSAYAGACTGWGIGPGYCEN
jgi:hypothetical protein